MDSQNCGSECGSCKEACDTTEELLSPEQKKGIFELFDKRASGVLNNEQLLLAIKLLADKWEEEGIS